MVSILIVNIFIRHKYLQYTNCLSLSDKELGIVNPVVSVYTLREMTKVKTVSFLKRLPCALAA